MRAIITARVDVIIGLFVAVLGAHALLPATLPFALVLPSLCAIAFIWMGDAPRIEGVHAARVSPGTAPTGELGGMDLDDELAALEAELHALHDQHMTRVRHDERVA